MQATQLIIEPQPNHMLYKKTETITIQHVMKGHNLYYIEWTTRLTATDSDLKNYGNHMSWKDINYINLIARVNCLH